jgi:hypothetical protein
MLNRVAFLFSVATLLYCVAPIAAARAEFYATQDAAGEILVVDESGNPVPVVIGDPVGTRATVCPSDAYYIVALPTDMSQLVLTDCATETEQHSVEMQQN